MELGPFCQFRFVRGDTDACWLSCEDFSGLENVMNIVSCVRQENWDHRTKANFPRRCLLQP
jgi:hypothetical protein